MNVVSYIRVSGKGQLAGDGPERQRDSIAAFSKANNLAGVYREFFEQGISGTIEGLDRKAFSDMIEFLERDSMDRAIVVERMDRLARDLMVQEMLLKECRDRGIKVFAADVGLIDQATNDGDPTRKLIRQVLGAVAEFAKSELVLKLAKARKRKKQQTGRCEGRKPFGHYMNEKPVLDFVRGLVLGEPGITCERVACLLNQGNFQNRAGTKWTRQSANRIIRTVKGKR